jgi:uncharacterized protein (TIGR03000 family)
MKLSAASAGFVLLLACTPLLAQEPAARAEPAVLVVRVRAHAKVLVDGIATQQTGDLRRFASPPLEPGPNYTYTVAAVLEPNNYTKITRTRKVSVKPGQETEVDLREADPRQPDDIVVRYVPTPPFVVDAMLRLAGVGKEDVVYDLGCGDGRIVVTAVSKFGAKRGVGVDLDPARLKESADRARGAGVADRVDFRQGDVLKLDDLSEATVVAIYMGEDLNLRLRPILQKSLKPGARIVSHRFTMGDWKPDREETLTDPSGTQYRILLWKIGEK